MRYGSVCSGIEAVTVAFEHLGWMPIFFAEIDPFCCELLKQKYPNVPNYGDFTKIESTEPIDILVGGTPCQSFSVAGKRAGLDDPRGVLAFEFLRLAERLRPRWILFENVPGLLSSNKGRDFSAFIGAMEKCGYSCAWRIMDAQFTGVAQRRRRLFVVGYLGDWTYPAAVLFDGPGMCWNPPPSREAGKAVAGSLAPGAHAGSYNGLDAERGMLEIIGPVKARGRNHAGQDVDSDGNLIVERESSLRGNLTAAQHDMGQAQSGQSGAGMGLGEGRQVCSDISTVDARNKVDRGDSQHCERLIITNR